MENRLVESVVSIAVAIVGLAVVAVLVSRQADTANVITAGGNALSTGIKAAVSPVTGGSFGAAGTMLE